MNTHPNTTAASSPRTRTQLDAQWRFQLGDLPETDAASSNYSDSGWRLLDLPHDWSVELPRRADAPNEGHGGFFENGIGWYRKTLAVDPAWVGQRVVLEFEGVYCKPTVFVNGKEAARHGYGFTPFTLDLTGHVSGLAAGDAVTIAVRVDNAAQPAARWFTGSGIYRHVWLHVFGPTHIVANGVVPLTTSLSDTEAILRVETIVGDSARTANGLRRVSVELSVYDLRNAVNAGEPPCVAQGNISGALVASETRLATELKIVNPRPWSPESPSLYRIVARLREEGATGASEGLLDEVSVTTGLRTLGWSPERGLVLNGTPTKLNGGNIHHDNGILGAAAFDRAEERKVEMMKAAGFNTLRCAHNPHSRALLNACDRLGLLVVDEIYDGWAVSKTAGDYGTLWEEWHRHDVEAWLRRDRHHPSVIFWSIGNEVLERAQPSGMKIVRELAALVRSIDLSRPVTAAVNGPWFKSDKPVWADLDEFFAPIDVGGYNYELMVKPPREEVHFTYAPYRPDRINYLSDHERVPERLMMATESFQYEVFRHWRILRDYPYAIGDFVWTAIDYLGEAAIGAAVAPWAKNPGHGGADTWPWRGAYCGDIDLTGWRKPVSHYREILWNGEKEGAKKLYAVVHAPPPARPEPATDASAEGINATDKWRLTPWAMPPALPTWDWPGRTGEVLVVEVFSRYEAVRLILNGETLAEQPTTEAEEFKTLFRVPYAAGELVAVGLGNGEERERFTLKTGDPAAVLRATADRTELSADGQDVAFVTLEVTDAEGLWQPWDERKISVQVEGAGNLIGLGTGNVATNLDSYTQSTCRLFQGRALAVIRTKPEAGTITVRATAGGLHPAKIMLRSTTP